MEYGVLCAADWVWALWRRGEFLAAGGNTDKAKIIVVAMI
jgi:hypothetical protein